MNKVLGIFIMVLVSFSFGSCKKENIEVESLDFSYADDIEGTYIGIRRRDLGPYHPSEVHYIYYDTIVVEISDLRNSRTCKFEVDLWNMPIVVRPDMTYSTDYRFNTSYGHHTLGELSIKDGVLKYREFYKNQWDKYNDVLKWHMVLNLVLEKQE